VHNTTVHYTTRQYTILYSYTTPQLQLQLQLHTHTNYTILQLQIHYSTLQLQLQLRYTTLHFTTSSSCGWGDHCNHCSHFKKHNSNHLSVHQWICSAIRDSQQPTSPTGFLFLKLPPPPCAVQLVIIMNHALPFSIFLQCICNETLTFQLRNVQADPPQKIQAIFCEFQAQKRLCNIPAKQWQASI